MIKASKGLFFKGCCYIAQKSMHKICFWNTLTVIL